MTVEAERNNKFAARNNRANLRAGVFTPGGNQPRHIQETRIPVGHRASLCHIWLTVSLSQRPRGVSMQMLHPFTRPLVPARLRCDLGCLLQRLFKALSNREEIAEGTVKNISGSHGVDAV